MAVMLTGKCPNCGKEVKYGANEYWQPAQLCKRCGRISELKGD